MTSVPPLGTGAAKTVANRDITIRAQRRIDMNFFIVICTVRIKNISGIW